MSNDTSLDRARDLQTRGFPPIPVPHKSKSPRIAGWPTMRLTPDELPRHFSGVEANIGVLLGEAAGWLVDVDLDHPLAVSLADQYLPPTGMIWGRASKPRSHRIYQLTRPASTKKWASRSAGMIVELRSTGCQTLGPGSTHPSGEQVRWDDAGAPATIDPIGLLAAIESLANAVRGELGECLKTTGAPVPRPVPLAQADSTNYGLEALRREALAVALAVDGTRNETLNRAAFNVGTLIGPGDVARDNAERVLAGAARTCGLPDDEAIATIRSGLDAGEKHPRPPSVRLRETRDTARESLRRELPGVPVGRIVKRGGDRADFDLLTTDGRTVQLGDSKAVLDPIRIQAAIADVLGIVIRARSRNDWRPIAQALFDLAELTDEGDTEANQTRGWLAALGGGADARRIDLTDSAALARYLTDRHPCIIRGSDQRLYAYVYGIADALRRDMGLIVGERELRRRLTRLGFEACQLSARSDDVRFKGKVFKGRFLRSPPGFDAEEEPPMPHSAAGAPAQP